MYKYDEILKMALTATFVFVPLLFNISFVDDLRVKPDEIIERLNERVSSFPQEKIYIHTDKSVYALGEEIWFKAYLVNASTHTNVTPSSLVHVELKGPDDKVMKRMDIKMKSGWDRGDITIEKTWKPGEYKLIGYTAYMCNYNNDFLFQKSILIGDAFQQMDLSSSDTPSPVLRFYPEGGDLVAGLKSMVGFTAQTKAGRPLELDGYIEDENGNRVVPLKTYTPGYGRFDFTPDEGSKYRAVIIHKGTSSRYELPKTKKEGYVMSVNNRNTEHHIITVSANDNKLMDGVFILAHVRGIPVALIEDLEDNPTSFKIAKKDIPDGIMHITLFHKDGDPWCERLVYNNHADNKIQADLSIPFSHFKQRQKAQVNIELKDAQGNPVTADMSVSITDVYNVPSSDHALNIEHYLLMVSDLDDPLEDPGYYFADDSKSRFFQDLLLLTHGWRRFTWNDVIKEKEPDLNYPPKSGFDIKGNINKSNQPLESDMTVSLIGEDLQLLETGSDANGNFNLYEVEIWDTTDVVFQANDRKDKKIKNAKIEMIPEDMIAVDVDNVQPVGNIDEESMTLYFNTTLENERLDSFYKTDFSIDLEEVTVTSKRADINRRLKEERLLPYSDVDNRLLLDSLKYVQPYYTVFDIVKLSVPGVQVIGVPGVNQQFVIRGQSSLLLSNSATVLINGTPASDGAVNALRAADIEFIDVLKGLSKTAIYGDLGGGGIIAIYTKSGRKLRNRKNKIEGLFNMEHPGYYRVREFPSPDYSQSMPGHKKPDFRTTLYWSPQVLVNEEGRAILEFYTADRNTNYRVDLQGVSNDGRPISAVYFFDVMED